MIEDIDDKLFFLEFPMFALQTCIAGLPRQKKEVTDSWTRAAADRTEERARKKKRCAKAIRIFVAKSLIRAAGIESENETEESETNANFKEEKEAKKRKKEKMQHKKRRKRSRTR